MTTLVAIKTEHEVVLAADSRATSENYVFQTSRSKIIEMGNWAIAIAGDAMIPYIFNANKDSLKKTFKNMSFEQCLRLMEHLGALLHKAGVPTVKMGERDRYDYSALIVTNKGEAIYINPYPTIMNCENIVTAGSGGDYAEGAASALMHQGFSAVDIAIGAIEAAAKFDCKTDTDVKFISYTY